MGIFDFFKKKETKINDENISEKENQNILQFISDEKFNNLQFHTEIFAFALTTYNKNNNLDTVRKALKEQNLTTNQIEKIIQKLELLPKKNENKEDVTDSDSNGAVVSMNVSHESKSVIEFLETDIGDHDEGFAAVFGYQNMQTPELVERMMNKLIDLSINSVPIDENPVFKVCEADFTNVGGNTNAIRVRTIYVLRSAAGKNFPISTFPYLSTNNIIPFETNKVIYWKHSSKLEVEIVGGGRNTFSVGFYATDYAYNRHIYNTNKKLNIKMSAFAFVIDKSDVTEIAGTPVDPNFSTYIPNKEFNSNSHYNFIGKLLDFKEVELGNNISGYILSVTLINNDVDNYFFTVDMFVNKQNMRITQLTKGMKISGAIWLQGEIQL